jgi:signal peptidase I
LDNPQRGDIIVFKYPMDQSQYFIKRIIGLPGESVEIKDGMVYLYKKEAGEKRKFILDETKYLEPSVKTYGNKVYELGKDEYFVLGDNRMQSLDSRSFGPVYEDLIMGKVWFRGWPFNRFEVFEEMSYGLSD